MQRTTTGAGRSAVVEPGAATVGSYVAAFSPAPPWDELVRWPPDAFAVANLLLDHTEAYRFAIAPPPGRRWPSHPGWTEDVRVEGRAWRMAAGAPDPEVPDAVRRVWDVLTQGRDVPLADLRSGRAWDLCHAILTLHAMADEAAAGLSAPGLAPRAFELEALERLRSHGSLARLSAARVRITPKTHFAIRGITIRSFSRYLSLAYESVDLRWHRPEPPPWDSAGPGRRAFNLVLVPWPFRLRASDFRPVDGPLDNMDRRAFGFFEFAPAEALPAAELDAVVRSALSHVDAIDAVVLPEAALDAHEVEVVEAALRPHPVGGLVSGVRAPAGPSGLGENRLHLAQRHRDGWRRLDQAKHHRWCLDGDQIRQYHLCRSLDPDRQWWEAIDLPERRVQLLDVGSGATLAPLICEDLARLDEVADVLRRIGPTLVVALLLDGPQLATRWPARYATILADEPGSAVLTLTSLGMAARCQPPGAHRSRVVALWSGADHRREELSLPSGASALLLTAAVGVKTAWTADGRRHDNLPDLELTAVEPLRA